MKYLVIGAGGTGGAIGGFMTKAGKDVTLIARGAHLAAMQEKGLSFDTPDGKYTVSPIKACTMDDYQETPDVIFVCVKGYSLEETIPFIDRVAAPHTVVIPILNIYGTGGKMQENIQGRHVLILEDIFDTGNSLQFLVDHLTEKQPASLKICTLLEKPERRNPAVTLEADYVGFTIPNEFVVGYGLDFNEFYRNLPYVGVLKPEAYQ